MRTALALVIPFLLLPAVRSATAVEVPLTDWAGWSKESYRNIDPNDVTMTENGMRISVAGSASPLVYRFQEPVRISGATIEARWQGELRIPEGATQGEEGADDFVLKVGLVESGENTLNWLQRRIAADWIKALYSLAPEGAGVRRVNFLSTTQQKALLGTERIHPLNDLLHEERLTFLDSTGAFTLSRRFDEPVEILGLWVSADGDDTDSRFELVIERITLLTGTPGRD